MKNEPDGRFTNKKSNGDGGDTINQLFVYAKESEILKTAEEKIKLKYKF